MTERERDRRLERGVPLPMWQSKCSTEDDANVPATGLLVDSYGRRIRNLRISVTDKCNFRCTYCMPAEGLPWLKKTEILSYLQRKGARCWLVPKDHTSGANSISHMEEPLRRYDQLLLILSEHSVRSVWIEKEVQAAFEKETQEAKRVIFPILLDHTVRQTRMTWAADLGYQRPMGDFCAWKQHEQYLEAFGQLCSDLNK